MYILRMNLGIEKLMKNLLYLSLILLTGCIAPGFYVESDPIIYRPAPVVVYPVYVQPYPVYSWPVYVSPYHHGHSHYRSGPGHYPAPHRR